MYFVGAAVADDDPDDERPPTIADNAGRFQWITIANMGKWLYSSGTHAGLARNVALLEMLLSPTLTRDSLSMEMDPRARRRGIPLGFRGISMGTRVSVCIRFRIVTYACLDAAPTYVLLKDPPPLDELAPIHILARVAATAFPAPESGDSGEEETGFCEYVESGPTRARRTPKVACACARVMSMYICNLLLACPGQLSCTRSHVVCWGQTSKHRAAQVRG